MLPSLTRPGCWPALAELVGVLLLHLFDRCCLIPACFLVHADPVRVLVKECNRLFTQLDSLSLEKPFPLTPPSPECFPLSSFFHVKSVVLRTVSHS